MPSKQRHPLDSATQILARLESCGFLSVSGVDAADFLQRQTMNDVRALSAIGHWHWNGTLSPKGRVLALFALLRTDPHGFVLIHQDGDVGELAAALTKVVFRSKVRIEAVTCRAVGMIGVAPEGVVAHGAVAQKIDDGWLLDMGSPERPRQLWFGADPDHFVAGLNTAAAQPASDETARAAWLAEDLRHGVPRLSRALHDKYTPHMLGLSQLAAFSVKKGCYPGQEIVARTHFLGAAKRQLALLSGQTKFCENEELQNANVQSQVLVQVSDGYDHLALAVLPVGQGELWHRSPVGTATVIPFVQGLARSPD